MNLLAAELRRLKRPVVIGGLACSLGIAIAFFAIFSAAARRNVSNADAELMVLAQGPTAEVCHLVQDGSGRDCATLLAARVEGVEAWRTELLTETYSVRGAIGDPLGSLVLAGGFAGSLPGMVFFGLLAAVHVAGEWSAGTAGERFARDPRRGAFIWAKFASIWSAGILALVTAWVVLGIATPLIDRLLGPSASAADLDLDLAWRRLTASATVFVFLASLGVAAGVATRRAILAFALFAGILIVASLLTISGSQVSPISWIAVVMAFEPLSVYGDHVGVSAADPAPSSAFATVALAGVSLILLLLSRAALRAAPLDD